MKTAQEWYDSLPRAEDCCPSDVEHIQMIIDDATAGLRADLYEAEQRLRNAESILNSLNYHRCDVPACNCNSYHADTPELESGD